ncbi:MAG: hypothetical protein GTN93_15600 [Anaerolineae bacterium]|nr:hypothetical protein [Anaerolineae bacterium]
MLQQSGYVSDPNDIVGRDEIAQAIATAESRIADFLGFFPAPTWVAREQHEVPQVQNAYQLALLHTNWGYLIAAGVEQWDLIQSGVTVNYSTPDGDAVNEWASISFATTVTDVQELAVVPPGRDPTTREWRIRPLTASITTGTATMQGWAWLFADPDLWLGIDAGALGTDQLATVDVYRHYNKTYPTQSEYEWLPSGESCAGTNQTCTPVCQSACVVVASERVGQFYARPATWSGGAWNNANWASPGQPNNIRVWYYSGYRDPQAQPNEHMGEALKTAIVRLANCYLPQAPCGCSYTDQRWVEDRDVRQIESYDIAQTQVHFGTTMAGAVYARSVCSTIPPLGQGG